ncbi:MAG: hypothetical protein ABIQ88_11680 [Chitinophagaceae bacterium]
MNNPTAEASPTVIISNVTADRMSVNVNGEIKEIKNGLDELKLLLKNISAENFSAGSKIYNIGSISNAVFNAEIGKKTFNMHLCRKLTESLRPYSASAKMFLDNMRETDKPDWETQSRYTRKANGYIISSFVGVIGLLIQKLISSGKDAFTSNSSKDYLEVCVATCTRSMQLLCFAFISKLWDHKKDNNCELSRSQANTLDNFFAAEIELNIKDYLDLLNTLVNIFDENTIEYPFSEFNKDCLAPGNVFTQACNNLEIIHSKVDAGQATLSTAFEAEIELTEFLCTLSFLASYKMVSVKNITYEEIRNKDVHYLHAYTFLGVDNDDKLFSQKFKYDTKPISSDAILIFKNQYYDGLNLFPFIIDVHAITNEQEVKICFFTYAEENRRKLTYSDINRISSDRNESATDISDPSHVNIIYNEEVENDLKANIDNDITRIRTDAKKYNDLQLNIVYTIFQTARNEILA